MALESAQSASDSYDLSRLGWLLFEELSAAWLERTAGVRPSAWRGSADRLRHVVLEQPPPDLRLERPTAAVALYVRPNGLSPTALTTRLAELHDLLVSEGIRGVLVLTNLDSRAIVGELGEPFDSERSLQVLGAAELGAAIDADAGLRVHLPFVLGVRRGSPPTTEACSFDVDEALRLAERFVPTRAYRRALEVLEAHRFCVLTGPPEMGKTASARMIGLALATAGWEVYECIRPEQVRERLRPGRPQLFVADDAFGSTEYRPEAAERWARELPGILAAMDERHWLIWTSRPTPLKAGLARVRHEEGAERFPHPGEVHVDAADLDVAEKALILYRHALAALLRPEAVELVRAEGTTIVEHPHFTPERIRRFVQTQLPKLAAEGSSRLRVWEAIVWEIERPTEAMAASFRALGPLHRAVLVGMLDCAQALVPERELAHAARRHVPAGLERSPVDLIDRLTDHFLRVVPPHSVSWVHPSWRDLVIDELAADPVARGSFIARCGHHGALLALSTGGGPAGERSLPLLLDDRDWDALGDHLVELVHEADEHQLGELLGALRAALVRTRDAARQAELRSLASLVFRVASYGRPARHPAGLGLLEEWLRLRRLVPDAIRPPWLPCTWIETLPLAVPDLASSAELTRFEDWLALVEMLRELDPEVLDDLGGIPPRQIEIAHEVLAGLDQACEGAGPARAERLNALALRIGRALGVHAKARAELAMIAEVEERVAQLEAEKLPDLRVGLVSRVLADLG